METMQLKTQRGATMRLSLCASVVICGLAVPALGQQGAPAAVPVGTVMAERKPIAKTFDFVGRVEAVNLSWAKAKQWNWS
jgi:membrane fusion protein (multidrug efflux system)